MSKQQLLKTLLVSAALSSAFIVGFGYSARGEVLGQQPPRSSDSPRSVPHRHRSPHDANGNRLDPRPARWCGWWLRHQLGVSDRAFNLARNWARYGSPASPDCVNCIAVYPHHVGLVTGRPSPRTIILKSGNDGHAVRERERSSRGVIAWRWPNGSYASQ